MRSDPTLQLVSEDDIDQGNEPNPFDDPPADLDAPDVVDVRNRPGRNQGGTPSNPTTTSVADNPNTPEAPQRSRQRSYLNLADLMRHPPPPVRWLVPDVIPHRALVSIYSPSGAGKSLLALEWCVTLAQDGTNVLYIDSENRPHLIRQRLEAMGIDTATAERATQHLAYSCLGDWLPLDTAPGGRDLVEQATQHEAQLVVIDTITQNVAGEENSADTYKNLHRHTLQPLSRQTVSVLMLDHTGHSSGTGAARGSSQKRGNLDVDYSLSADGNTITLTRKKNRIGADSPEVIQYDRLTDPLRHMRRNQVDTTTAKTSDRVADIVAKLDDLDAEPQMGRDNAAALLRHNGIPVSTQTVAKAVKQRQERDQG